MGAAGTELVRLTIRWLALSEIDRDTDEVLPPSWDPNQVAAAWLLPHAVELTGTPLDIAGVDGMIAAITLPHRSGPTLVHTRWHALLNGSNRLGEGETGRPWTCQTAMLEAVMSQDSCDTAVSGTAADQQTFSCASDKKRLSGTALAAFRSVADRWDLSASEAAALLGTSESTWRRIRRGTWDRSLSQDGLTRISAIVGTYKGLHLLFADDMADRWPRLPNTGPLFQRRSPVEAMIVGGIPLMVETRRYVDALRGGL